MSPRDWYVCLAGDADRRLFAFPHAGAGSARMVRLANAVAPDVSLWAANLPGRQARVAETPFSELDALVAALTDHLMELARPPYALFGYCGGGLTALLVARALRERGAPAPAALIVASYEAPDIAHRPRRVATLPSGALWSWLRGQGGVTDGGVDDRLRAMAEPAIRADFAMLAGYRYTPAAPLDCPVVVCFGRDDPTPRGAWLGWRRQSADRPRLCALDGGHWLLEEAPGELAALIVEVLSGAARSPDAAAGARP